MCFAIKRKEKKEKTLLPTVGSPWDSLPPPPESVRTYGRTYADATTKLTFLASTGYQGGLVNLSIAPIGIARRMIMAIVTSQAGQVWNLKWLTNKHIARSLSRVIIQRI